MGDETHLEYVRKGKDNVNTARAAGLVERWDLSGFDLAQLGLGLREALPGRPDFVLPQAKIALFVDGAFWHGRYFERWRHKLSPFWREKIVGNVKRDRRNHSMLRRMGWFVLRIWEEDLEREPERCLAIVQRIVADGRKRRQP